jgi:hypothetical protein
MTDKSKVKNDKEVKKNPTVNKDTKKKHPFIFTKDIIEDCLSTCLG